MILNVWKSTNIVKAGKSMKAEKFVRADKFDWKMSYCDFAKNNYISFLSSRENDLFHLYKNSFRINGKETNR